MAVFLLADQNIFGDHHNHHQEGRRKKIKEMFKNKIVEQLEQHCKRHPICNGKTPLNGPFQWQPQNIPPAVSCSFDRVYPNRTCQMRIHPIYLYRYLRVRT